MNALSAMSCWKCGFEEFVNLGRDGCPACGGRSTTIHDSSKLWKQIATLKLLRNGVALPNYRRSPLYGKSSRSKVITDFAVANKL
jgi:hypothetical protein